MTKRIYKRTNPYSGQSEVLTNNEAMLYDMIKQAEQMELQDIYYDVGLMVGHCLCINKSNLSNKIYAQFMGSK